MQKLLKFIENHFGVVVSSGIIVGLLLGDLIVFNPNFLSVLLMLMILLSALKTDLFSITKYFKKPFWIIFLTIFKLILLPLVVFLLVSKLLPDFQTGLILLSCMPAAVAAPGIISLINGDIKLGLLVSVFTNLLVPFTVPFILYYTIGATVQIDITSMLFFLILIVFVPFFIAFFMQKFSSKAVKKINKNSGGVLALIVFLFMVTAIAPYRNEILADINFSIILLLLSIGLFIFSTIISYLFFIKSSKKMLTSNIVLIVFNNAGLAIVLAAQYFDTSALLMSVFYEVPWALGLIPLQMFFRRKVVK